MALARWERPIQDAEGNLVLNVWCEVRVESIGTPLAVLYSDREGTVALGNPFFTADGIPAFHALGAAYQVHVYATGFEDTYRYQAVGTGGEVDANALLQPGWLMQWEPGTTAPPSSGSVRANDADLDEATILYVSKANFAGSDIEQRLLDLSPGGKANKNLFAITASSGEQVAWAVEAVTDHSGYVELAVSGHNGVTALNAAAINVQLITTGSDGATPGLSYRFDTTTAASDPGNGKFRLNSSSHASATAAYIDNVEFLAAANVTAELDSWDDSANAVRGTLRIVDRADPTVFRLYRIVGAVVNSSGYRTVPLSYVAGNGTLADAADCALIFVPAGNDGTTSGLRYLFATATGDGDPGAGAFRLNNATLSSVTQMFIDNLDNDGGTVSGFIDTWDDPTSTIKGKLMVRSAAVPSTYALFNVTGTVVDGSGYRKVTLSHQASHGSFSAGELVGIDFDRGGDTGGGSVSFGSLLLLNSMLD